jgi:hypothetical protein
MHEPHDTQKVAIIQPGRYGARLGAMEDDVADNDTPDEDDTPRRRRATTRAQAAESLDAPHPMLRFSTDELRAELARRQREIEYLKLQHGALLRQVAELEAKMARLTPGGGGLSRGPRAPRAPRGPRAVPAENTLSLADAIAAAVNVGDVITPAQAGERVLASGYKSNAQRFGVLVATALAKDERFVRVGRGQYRRMR